MHRHRAFRECGDRKSTRLNSSHLVISYAVFCLKKKKIISTSHARRTRLNHNNLTTPYAVTRLASHVAATGNNSVYGLLLQPNYRIAPHGTLAPRATAVSLSHSDSSCCTSRSY